jgi:hypothetical protein
VRWGRLYAFQPMKIANQLAGYLREQLPSHSLRPTAALRLAERHKLHNIACSAPPACFQLLLVRIQRLRINCRQACGWQCATLAALNVSIFWLQHQMFSTFQYAPTTSGSVVLMCSTRGNSRQLAR